MKILVIAAHPDDEVIGCGGTLYKLSKNKGNKIFLSFAADGVFGRGNEKALKIRQKESVAVAKLLNAKILNDSFEDYYPFSDQHIDQQDFNIVVSWVKKIIEEVKPEIIYTHHAFDLNRDHQIIAEAVAVATRPNKYDFIKKIYSFEINMGSLNQGPIVFNRPFWPNVFEQIDLNRKIKLLRNYRSEQKYWGNWTKDCETIARFRGMGSGYNFAEAFILVRERND